MDKNWILGKTPDKVGWYAISYSYDTEEGIFPDASYWNGSV